MTFKGINGETGNQKTDMTSVMVYGRGYDYDLKTGMFTLTDTSNLPTSWSDETYKQLIGTYTCMSEETTCNEIYYVGHYQSATEASTSKYKISDVVSYSQLGTSSYNAYNESPALVGYMYNTVYRWKNEEKIGTYANDVSWDSTNQKYNLIEISDSVDNNHHYICDDDNCTKVRYYYFVGSYFLVNQYIYMLLENGETIESALKEMINYKQSASESNANVNVYSSAIKGHLDNWYKKNISETQSESYIDKNIAYCNDRSVSDLVGFNKNGGNLRPNDFRILKFKQYNVNLDLSCVNTTDRMSVANREANLLYSINLLSEPERGLMGKEYAATNQKYWWNSSPSVFFLTVAHVRCTYLAGTDMYNNVYFNYGVRPVISLRSDSLVTEGDGSYETPYVVGPIVTRDNINYNY